VLWDASGSICIPSVGQDCGLPSMLLVSGAGRFI
jgi:hypothetical protein